MTSIAAAARSRPILVRSSTALIVGRSMNSSIEGRSRRVMSRTVAVASSRVAKVATSVAGGRWAGISRSTTRVITPRVPSLPTNSLVSDSPATSLSRGPPSSHRGAVGEHDGQPEHVVGRDAVLHAAQPAGVGGDVAADRADLERRRVGRVPEPVLRGRRLDLGVERAGLGHQRCGSPGRRRSRVIRSVETTRQPSTADEPPDSPLPAPRGTTASPCSAANRTAAWTSSVELARTTASGTPASGSLARSHR